MWPGLYVETVISKKFTSIRPPIKWIATRPGKIESCFSPRAGNWTKSLYSFQFQWEEKGRQIFGEWRGHILALQSAKDEPILLTVHLLARTCKDCRRQTPNISLLWYSAGSALCFRTKRQQLRLCSLMYCWKYLLLHNQHSFVKKNGRAMFDTYVGTQR